MLKRELVRGIVISNTCVKLYRNWIINEVARAGEHTNERTYVLTYIRTGQTLYPLHNFVVRGDNKSLFTFDKVVLMFLRMRSYRPRSSSPEKSIPFSAKHFINTSSFPT